MEGFDEKKEPLWSVSDVNAAVRELVEGSLLPFWVTGEVSSLLVHRSGHVYMTLKDQKSQLRACWFGGAEQCRTLALANGAKIEAYGRLTVYPARGEYQFSIRSMRIAGLGDLYRRFGELKRKLEAEGLFAPGRKRPIPKLPRVIGVVTSPSGAAIRDFLKIIDRRFPRAHIRICPCQVQGAGAAAEIAAAVDFLSRSKCADVAVVTRGGGSMEDLWAFNDERVARAIFESEIPVISAVGHEPDVTIADFVADLRAATPSNGAELAVPESAKIEEILQSAAIRSAQAIRKRLELGRRRVEELASRRVLQSPMGYIDLKRMELDLHRTRLLTAQERRLTESKQGYIRAAASLDALSPLKVLSRGYAVASDSGGKVLRSVGDVAPGDEIEVTLQDGSLSCTVDKRKEHS